MEECENKNMVIVGLGALALYLWASCGPWNFSVDTKETKDTKDSEDLGGGGHYPIITVDKTLPPTSAPSQTSQAVVRFDETRLDERELEELKNAYKPPRDDPNRAALLGENEARANPQVEYGIILGANLIGPSFSVMKEAEGYLFKENKKEKTLTVKVPLKVIYLGSKVEAKVSTLTLEQVFGGILVGTVLSVGKTLIGRIYRGGDMYSFIVEVITSKV